MKKQLLLVLAMSASVATLAGCAGDRTKGSSPSGGSSGEVLVVPPPSDSGATTAPANPPTVIVVPVEPQEAPPAGSMGSSPPGGTSEQWREEFRQLDANGDGLIDQNEAQGDINFSALFGRLDMNSDGVISPSEYEAMHSGSSGAGASGGEGSGPPPDAVIVPGPAVIVPQEDPAAGSSASGSAGSSERASSGSGFTFQQLDGDNDTQIDRQEAAQYPTLSDNFDQADVNKDEVITGSEYDSWALAQGQSSGSSAAGAGSAGGSSSGSGLTFQQLDGDNDTQIDRQEANQYPSLSDNFDQADLNKDEVITGSEYDTWSQSQSSGSSATGAGSTGGTSGSGITFQQLDTDNDTYIDKQEAQQHSALSDNFEQADVNKDNVITGSEYQSWSEKQGG
jgi:hypothetical protein